MRPPPMPTAAVRARSCPRIHDASTNLPSLPSRCPSALPSEFCIGESLVSASPEQFRKRYHASKGKPRPWGRYSASTAMRATFSKGSLARGTDAVCKRCRIFKGIPSLCKRYNACKVWYRCTSGGISVKAAPLFHRCEMRPGAVVGQRRRLHGALRVQRDASGQETTHWGRACAGGTGAEGGIGVGNHLLGQVISLPQWPVACPNAPLPAPMRFHTRQVPVEGCRPAPRRDRPPRRDRGPGRRAPPWPAQPAFS